MEEAIPTGRRKAGIFQDILPASTRVGTLSSGAISHAAVTAIIMVTTVHAIITEANMDACATGTKGTDTSGSGAMGVGGTRISLDIAAKR